MRSVTLRSRYRNWARNWWAQLPLLVLGLLLGALHSVVLADTGAGDPANPAFSDAASNPSDLDRRLASAGLARGEPVLIRIFKEESELELWMQSGERFHHFATYPICRWRGVLGPKLNEGDRQSPEGFYSFGQDQLFWQGHWFRAFNINYPNALDRSLGRTGSGILRHGACSSIGCYAMTDPIIDEIFDLVVAAFAAGQPRVQVHIFPFHMTLANLSRHESNPWSTFWQDLKPASDLFVSTQLPPRIGVCDGRYVVRPGQAGEPAVDRIADWCGSTPWHDSADRLPGWQEARRAEAAPPAIASMRGGPSERVLLYARLSREGKIPKPQPLPDRPASFGPSPEISAADPGHPVNATLAALPESERAAMLGKRTGGYSASSAGHSDGDAAGGPSYTCNAGLAACRHYIATHAVGTLVGHGTKAKVAKRLLNAGAL
jgi:murein L,D-transpeptidase YafK